MYVLYDSLCVHKLKLPHNLLLVGSLPPTITILLLNSPNGVAESVEQWSAVREIEGSNPWSSKTTDVK